MKYSLRIILAVSVLSISACDGGSDSPPPVPPPQSAANVIQSLEAQGQLPVLDREATLPGIDSNGDGVRDDLERHIGTLPDTEPQKNSLRQLAKALSGTLTVDTANETAMRAVAGQLSDSINCVWRVYPPETAGPRVEEIRRLSVNTRTRFEAYAKYNQARSGAVIAIPTGDTCQ